MGLKAILVKVYLTKFLLICCMIWSLKLWSKGPDWPKNLHFSKYLKIASLTFFYFWIPDFAEGILYIHSLPNVCTQRIFSGTVYQIFLIFCMKLKGHKWRKLTKPNCFKKILVSMETGSKGQIWAKIDRFSIYLKICSPDFFDFLRKLKLNSCLQVTEVKKSKKIAELIFCVISHATEF